MQIARSQPYSPTASWRETLVLLLTSWLVPVLVHLVPWHGSLPLGVALLPGFWTAFVALYFFGAGTGLLVALVTPAVNLLTTGLPAWERVGTMSLELTAYVLLAVVLVRRWPRFRLAAPLAYLPAKAATIALVWALPGFHESRPPLLHFGQAVGHGAAGLGVLLLLNGVLVRLAPRDADRDAR